MTKGRLKGWRRVASAIWPAPMDPQIYATLDLDAGPSLSFIEGARRAGHRVTPTHLVGRALARALAAVPELNVRIVGQHYQPRERTEIFFITALSRGGADLSGVKVDVADKSALQLGAELERGATALRAGRDRAFARTKRLMDALPGPLLRASLHGASLLTGRLQRDVPLLALKKDPFGSAIVSSVGSLGLSRGFAPLSWMYDVPLLLLVGEIAEQAVAVSGKVVARPILPISATIDHRYVDGLHLSRALQSFRAYLADPAAFEPALPAPRDD